MLKADIARLLAAFCLLTVLSSCNKGAEITVGWSAAEPAGTMTRLLAEELGDDFIVHQRTFANASDLNLAIQRGEVDLAIVEEPASPTPGLQALRAMFPSVLHVLAKPELMQAEGDSIGIAEVIRGHSVYAGPPGGAGHALLQTLVEQNVFPPLADFTLLESVFGPEPDILLVFGGILPHEELPRLQAYRLVSLGSVADYGRGSWAEGIAMRSPSLNPIIIPAGLYPSIGEQPTLTLSVQSLLVTHADLQDDIAYRILARADQLMAGFREIYSLAGRSAREPGEISYNLAAHSGALRYQQREAPGFLERYAEVVAVLITAILGSVSLLLAYVRYRKQARKDRIDVYFDELLELRERLFSEPATAGEIHSRIVQLQQSVTSLVSEERISADSAYIGFLQLSNQILKESYTGQ